MTNYSQWTSKKNKTQICHWFVQTIGLLSWLSLCFNHLDFQHSGNAGLQYPHSTLKEPPSPLKFMINFFQCHFFSYSLQKLTLAFLPPPLVVVVLSLIYMNELHCTKCMNRRKKAVRHKRDITEHASRILCSYTHIQKPVPPKIFSNLSSFFYPFYIP